MHRPWFRIPEYHDYLSPSLAARILNEARPVPGIEGLDCVGAPAGLESIEALEFLVELYQELEPKLARVLKQRAKDRAFIDERAPHVSVIGLEDAQGRVVFGPLSAGYSRKGGNPIAPLPDFLKGPHVTLFGPPDSAKMAINAMNAYHRKLADEPAIVSRLLAQMEAAPMWGADDEDSKTPIHSDLVDASNNLAGCFSGALKWVEGERSYVLERDHLSLPIKRFPGLALPSSFLFFKRNPIPLHLYDFALHFFHHRMNPRALVFYVPKLENEEEASYVHDFIARAEAWAQRRDSRYVLGSVRLMVVLENPRAILRAHEIMDALHPYFAGASLGWHDFLASTARLYKEDPSYRIPVKADPDIVIKYIQASHRLLAQVVGPRGAVKVGGMYGILPISGHSESLQVTLRGFFRDVVTQMKRDLTGFWVAHPDFVRLGLAIVQAWKARQSGDAAPLRELVTSLLNGKYAEQVLAFIEAPDVPGLDVDDPNYVRSLIVSDIKQSDTIPNNHPEEIRYNVFQSLQYLADWLRGNGCVALPTVIDGVPVRVMDDLATAERSRWEVWAELRHGRFSLEDFIRIAHEEMHFIRRDLSDGTKIVQVKWNEQTRVWYPIAYRIMLKLMTDPEPVEFATELLMPFTAECIRTSLDPLAALEEIDPAFLQLSKPVSDYDRAFEICGSPRFARALAMQVVPDLKELERIVLSFTREEIIAAAGFHGDIGQSSATLDARAASEQAGVKSAVDQAELLELGRQYRERFGFKFLISAQGKTSKEMLSELKTRLDRSETQEVQSARSALWEIAKKRLNQSHDLALRLEEIRASANVPNVSIAISNRGELQSVTLGTSTTPETLFQIASLSKPISAAFAMELFQRRGISLTEPVNSLLARTSSTYRIPGPSGDLVRVMDLLQHSALNLHYVVARPKEELLSQVQVIHAPGSQFQYSGGGFLVLEHLLEALEDSPISKQIESFFPLLPQAGQPRARGTMDTGKEVPGGGLPFPMCAAGGWSTSLQVARFLRDLTEAYHNRKSQISHDTAVEMLYGTDRGCIDFMGCRMGLGIFVAEAGRNRLAIHQGSNEGFRALFAHCFQGPDEGKGLVILATGDNRAVPMIAEMAKELFRSMGLRGIDWSRIPQTVSSEGVPQEHLVNKGYKSLLFDAFEPDLPHTVAIRGPISPHSSENLAIGARVLSVTDQKFALASNLISPHEPTFDPEEFCPQGKVMDSWESARHNAAGVDSLVLELKSPARFRYVSFSTRFHDGNHPERAGLWGFNGSEWAEIVAPTALQGHSMLLIDLGTLTQRLTQVRVDMYPDGGLTRLGLYSSLPQGLSLGHYRYPDAIPKTRKPLTIPFEPTGDRVIRASNEHYGPASQVLSPYPPLHMFDGFESARSRTPGHFEEVEIRLAQPARVRGVTLDFTFFVNNNPVAASIHARQNNQWIELAPKTAVKAFAGNSRTITFSKSDLVSEILVRIYPDGGINRIRVLGSPA